MALPAALTLREVTGTYVDFLGEPAVGTITFTPAVRLVSATDGTAVLPKAIIGRLTTAGALMADNLTDPLELPITDDADLEPTGWTYSVTEVFEGYVQRTFALAVPGDEDPLDLPSASPAVDPVVPGGVAVTQVMGQNPNAQGQITTLTAAHVGAAATTHTHTNAFNTFTYQGTVATHTGVSRWYNDTGRTLTVSKIRAAVGTAPLGSALTVQLRKNGSTTVGTVNIAAGATTQVETLADQTLANGDYLTINITAVGSSTPGADLTVTPIGS